MTGKKRSQFYTDEQKSIAILYAKAAGYPDIEGAIHRASKQSGVPYNTLLGWLKREGKRDQAHAEYMDQLVEGKRLELKDIVEAEVRRALGSLDAKLEEASYRDVAWAAAVLIDKLQLLNDKPTQNVQQAITFERRGISTVPEHLAPGAVESVGGEGAL